MTLQPGVQFSGVATPCSSVVCNASDSLGSTEPVLYAISGQTSGQGIASLAQGMSGEVYAATVAVMTQTTQRTQQAVLNRLGDTESVRLTPFARVTWSHERWSDYQIMVSIWKGFGKGQSNGRCYCCIQQFCKIKLWCRL